MTGKAELAMPEGSDKKVCVYVFALTARHLMALQSMSVESKLILECHKTLNNLVKEML